MESPETYLGYGRGQNFASGPPTPDKSALYKTPYPLGPNQWGLAGRWTIGEEKSVSDAAGGRITFYFHARDLHLVMGPAIGNKPVRFKVTLDGQPPGPAHGVDSDDAGNGMVSGQRLYQLSGSKARSATTLSASSSWIRARRPILLHLDDGHTSGNCFAWLLPKVSGWRRLLAAIYRQVPV